MAGCTRHPATRMRTAAPIATMLMLAAALAGCDPGGAPRTAGAASAESPKSVVARLVAARGSRNYAALDALVLPGRASEIVEVLLAMDEFIAADAQLAEFLRDEYSPALAAAVSQSQLAGALDVFSRGVELLDEHIEENAATVAFTIDGALPAERAALRRVDGAWRYDPGPGYSPDLAKAFSRMARGLRSLHDDLRSGRVARPPPAVAADRIIEEIRARLLPGLRMLPPPPEVK